MVRRDLLKSAALAAAGIAGATVSEAAPRQDRSANRRGSPGSWVDTRDGQSLFVKDWGAGPPVVFLAAWGLPSDMWDYQMVPLSSDGLRCVAYDRRGHGRSSRPGTGYDFTTLAGDLAAVLDALDLRGVTLVGMSMAGGEIVRYLTRHGARRVAKIVLVSTAATPFRLKTADNPTGIPAEQAEYFRRRVLLRDYPQWLEDNRAPFFVAETTRQMQEWIRTLMVDTSLKALVECSRSMMATDFRAELPAIATPALVIHGDKDASAPIEATGRPTAALLPRATLKVYEGGPHGLFVTHMDRLTADILEFVRT